MQKPHSAVFGKGGFTLVELSIVLALSAILVTMVVSFSVLMNGFASENKAEYDFLEDHAVLREELCTWVAENDVTGSIFKANNNGTLSVTGGEALKTARFAGGVLILGEEQRAGLDDIDGIYFTSEGKLIKCTTYRIAENRELIEHSFVFSLRCGVIEEAAGE